MNVTDKRSKTGAWLPELPYTKYALGFTRNDAERAEYGIELAIRLWSEYDAGDYTQDLIRLARPDMTAAEICEWVEQICSLSRQVVEAEEQLPVEAWESLKDDYATLLTQFATRPVMNVDDALAIPNGAARAINDELARRRDRS